MKEPFDKKLVEKIRNSFESHQEQFDPNEWEKFAEAYFAKPRRGAPFWLYWAGGIAASFLLFALLWNPFQSAENTKDMAKPVAFSKGESVEAPDFHSENQEPFDNELQGTVVQPSLTPQGQTSEKISIQTELAHWPNSTIRPSISQSGESILLPMVSNEPMIEEVTRETAMPLALDNKNVPMPGEVDAGISQQTEDAQQKINSWLAEGGNLEDLDTIEGKAKKPVKFGAFLAPQNISNSTQNVNFGAGLMSEIPFSKRLKFDVGLGYAKQNLVPDQSFGRGAIMAQADSDESARASMFAGNSINATSELSFGQIEIPLNMKYSVLQKKSSDLYLVSGLSNMFYLNQEKTTTYNSVVFATNAMSGGVQTLSSTSFSESPSSSGGKIDVGQLINLGFGFEQHLKNGTSLSFEPFYKFSLNDQTFVDQRFAIGGINLRMNFQLKK